jgi:hypothetical protein
MATVDPLLIEAEEQRRTVTLASGQKVIVRELTMSEFAAYGDAMGGKGDDAKRTDALARLFATAIIREDGSPRFTVAEAFKIARSARVAAPIVQGIMDASGFGTGDAGKKD